MKRSYLLLLCLILMLVCIFGLVVRFYPSPEPSYNGAKLRVWADHINLSDVERDIAESKEAIQHIGTNAIPIALCWLRVSDFRLKKWVRSLASRQSFFEFDLTDADGYHDRAFAVFEILGSKAKPAVPELQKMLRQPEVRDNAAEALCLIGPDAVPAIINLLTNTNFEIREAMGYAVADSYLDAAPRPGLAPVELNLSITMFSQLLHDSEAGVRLAAILQLGKCRQITPEQQQIIIPLLIGELRGPNSVHAARALKRFGQTAKSAVPTLRALATNNDESVRIAAAEALKEIDPERATKQGIR